MSVDTVQDWFFPRLCPSISGSRLCSMFCSSLCYPILLLHCIAIISVWVPPAKSEPTRLERVAWPSSNSEHVLIALIAKSWLFPKQPDCSKQPVRHSGEHHRTSGQPVPFWCVQKYHIHHWQPQFSQYPSAWQVHQVVHIYRRHAQHFTCQPANCGPYISIISRVMGFLRVTVTPKSLLPQPNEAKFRQSRKSSWILASHLSHGPNLNGSMSSNTLAIPQSNTPGHPLVRVPLVLCSTKLTHRWRI